MELHLSELIRNREQVLVLPEGCDERIIRAARILRDRSLAKVVLLGTNAEIQANAAAASVSLRGIEIVDPNHSDLLGSFAQQYLQLRSGTQLKIARRLVKKPLFFAGSMLTANLAQALVAGVAAPTARVIEACLATVGLADGINTPSSCFLMLLPQRSLSTARALIYADCAVTLNPNREQLVDIALASAATARALLVEEPRVAFLAFSTKGSGEHAMVRKMREAAEQLAARAPDLAVDGELQADAALSERVAQLKLDDIGPVAGRANVLIFPDLNAGNIAYKLTEQLAGARAIGPLLQGFARPVADLSRGATVEDIVTTAIVTLANSAISRGSDQQS
jgi:phosphate acetyltransferase